MSDLGNLYFSVMLKDMTDADIDKIKKKLEKVGVKVGAEVNRQTLEQSIRDMLKHKTFDVNLDVNRGNKKASIEVNKSILTKSVTDALKGQTFSADLKLVIRNATVQDAIRQAFAQAGMKYNTTASDVRAQRIAEIQQRMAIRAANAQRNLGNAHRYAASGAHESARASVVLGRSFHSNIRLAGELGTAMGNFASVFGIKDVLRDLVQIGGQLENQKIALGAILQDGGKATEMFSKIQSLAVKSPFGIMDLNQYTKQLAAYSVPYNELYDTMKRLADISAGVGVDMGRIVLAFGQVRAAGFLKGTELRQFTEANIPLVDKLAERFSILEKRIVSAGEVYDMISKKKISFEDVKAVLWELTGEGGMFNNMQEVLSESLASKWKNLADAVDVMYGKISEGWVGGGLKLVAEGLTELTKNWEYLGTAIVTATGAYLAHKAAVLLGSRQIAGAKSVYDSFLSDKRKEANNLRIAQTYRGLTRAEQMLIDTSGRLTTLDARRLVQTGQMNKELALQLIATKRLDDATVQYLARIYGLNDAMVSTAQRSTWLRRAFVTLGNTLRGVGLAMKAFFLNPMTWVFAVIAAVGEVFTYYSKKQDEIEERNKNFAESAKGSAETLERELLKIKDLDITKLNTDEMKVKVKEFTTIIQNEADGWQSILSEIFAKEADGTFKNSVKEQLRLLKAKMDELAEAKKKLMGDDDMYSDVIGSTEKGVLWWETDVLKEIEEYNKAVDKNDKKLRQLGVHARSVSDALALSIKGNKKLSEELAGKDLNEQVELLVAYSKEWTKFISELSKTNPKAGQIINIWKANIPSRKDVEDNFAVAKKAMDSSFALKGEDISNFTERGRQAVLGFAEGIITETATQKPRMQQWIYDWWTGAYNIPRNDLSYIVPPQVTDPGDDYQGGKDAVAEMWKKRADEIAKAVKMYDDWKKVEGKLLAENRVKYNEELSNLFNGAYGFNLDLENPTEAYEYIKSILDESKEAQKDLKIQLGVKISDAELKDAQDELKDFLDNTKTYIDKTIKGWELYKKIFESTGNKSLAMNLAFGGNVSFENQLKELEAKIREVMEALGIGIDFSELIKMDTKALEDAGWNGVAELIKKYNEESRKFKQESIDNFIDIIKASKDFEQQIADIDRKLQKDLADLTANSGKMQEGELERRQAELIANAEEEKTKVRFEEFKKSSDWVKVFDDLDRVSNDTLDMMIRKIEEFAKQAHLSEEVTKQLVNAMAKLRDESIERNPFEGFKDAWNRLKNLRDALKRGKMDDGLFYVKQSNGMFKGMTKEEVDDETSEANADLNDSALAVANKFKAVADASDMLTGLFENMGISMDGFLGAISDVLGGAASGAQTGAGIASALGVAGPWGAVAGAAVGMLSSVFAMHDKALQKEIEASERREEYIKNVADNLEALFNRNMGGIYTMELDDETREMLRDILYEDGNIFKSNDDYSSETKKKAQEALRENSYYDAQYASLLAQRDEIQKQMELEDEKKKTDKDKMADYQQQLAEMELEIAAFVETMANELYGIDFKGWANQLAESLVDAWASGEDAVKAYKDTVTDILKDLGVSIITQKIIEPLLNDTMEDFLAQFEKDNGKLTDTSMEILAGMYEGAEYAASATEAYLEGLKKMGIDVSDTAEESSSGLSKGIQSVTEDTADLLASYVNAIRADVSVKRSLIEKLIAEDIPNMSYLAEAQLRELSQIQANTAKNVALVGEIRDLVNRVVDKGSNKLKV